jgi:arginyl-tRNA synthetase
MSLPKANHELLKDPAELELIKELARLESVVESIVADRTYPVHFLPFYAESISAKFHAFYDKCRVIDETSPDLTAARLDLVTATKIILGIVAHDLIGVSTPERM